LPGIDEEETARAVGQNKVAVGKVGGIDREDSAVCGAMFVNRADGQIAVHAKKQASVAEAATGTAP